MSVYRRMWDFSYASAGGAITVFAEVHPSGILSAAQGKVTSERKFLVPCAFAQQFALRMIGKWYDMDPVRALNWKYPQLPAPFPQSTAADEPHLTQRLNLVATSWSVQPMSACCFNNEELVVVDETACSGPISNAGSITEAARYYKLQVVETPGESEEDPSTFTLELPEDAGSDKSCLCEVTISYQEPPWDCENRPNSSDIAPLASLMKDTAIGIERQTSYEMFTAPNRGLKWKNSNIPDGLLRGDSYATIIVPKADITVYWYNVPVTRLCEVETHLTNYRGAVNSTDFDLFKDCLCEQLPVEFSDCSETGETYCQYRPNTLMFVDFQERKEDRTRAYGAMDTTTIVLIFKHRFIPTRWDPFDPTKVIEYAHWQHLYSDQSRSTAEESPWQEVETFYGDPTVPPVQTKPLFPQIDFTNILNP